MDISLNLKIHELEKIIHNMEKKINNLENNVNNFNILKNIQYNNYNEVNNNIYNIVELDDNIYKSVPPIVRMNAFNNTLDD